MIKKFKHFFEGKSGDMFPCGCVLMYLDINDWDEIVSIIDEEDIYNPSPRYGIEYNPHVTLIFGLDVSVSPDQVEFALSRFKNQRISLKINGIGKFDNEEYSVVKLNVDSPILHEINEELSKLPHKSDFPNYIPHITISYVKPGKADKYLSDRYRKDFNEIKNITYSMSDGTKKEFKL